MSEIMKFKNVLIIFLLIFINLFMFAACEPKENSENGENSEKPIEQVTNIYLSKDFLIMQEGEIEKIDVSANSPDFDVRLATWTSSSESVVVAAGTVIAVAPGYAEVTAEYGNARAVCKVGVSSKNSGGFSLSAEQIVLDEGQESAVSVIYEGQKYPNVAWRSYDAGVVQVENGKVCAFGAGETILQADVHGIVLQANVIVAGVDGNLKEWYPDGEPLYRGVELSDLAHSERRFVVYARKTDEGLYLGGSAWHATHVSGESLWHQNTNFEAQVLYDNISLIQYYASEGFRTAAASTYIKTYPNTEAKSEYDLYRTDFELFIPYVTTEDFIRCGVAFKTPGEQIAMLRGGDAPFISKSDWWWVDLHCPSNAAELYYIYDDGIYETAKEVA